MGRPKKIVKFPDTKLKMKSFMTNASDKLIENLKESMMMHGGVGLSAVQISVPSRVFIVLTDVYIDPEIVKTEGTVLSREGCLSLPNIVKTVERHEKITIRYTNEKRESVQKELDGLDAKIFQHEYDHLNGITLLDKKGIQNA